MIDVVTVGAGGGSIAWISPEGTLKVGPQQRGRRPGPDLLRPRRRPADDHRRARAARPDPAAPARRRGAARRGPGRRRAWTPWPTGWGCRASAARPACWRSPRGTRPTRCARSPSSAGSTSATSRWSRSAAPGSLLACRLVDILGLDGVLVPLNPGNLSAYGLLTVDVRNDYVQTAVARAAALDRRTCRRCTTPWAAGPTRRWSARASPSEERVFVRTADLRYFGQAYEVRVDVPDGPVTAELVAAVARRLPRRAPRALRLRLPRRPAPGGRVGEPPGHRRRPDPQAVAARGRRRAGARSPRGPGRRQVFFDDWVEAGGLRPGPARRRRRRRGARRCSRSSPRRCRCTRASPRGSTASATC